MHFSLVVSLIFWVTGTSFAQYNLNYVDPSIQTSRREQRRKATPTPGANAAAAGSFNPSSKSTARQTPVPRTTTTATSKSTTGSRTVSKATPGPGQLGQPGAAGKGKAPLGAGSAGFSQTGATREKVQITREMVEALRTHKVDFDAEEMSEKPGIIMLNPRKYKAPQSSPKSDDPLVQPL